MAGRRLGTTKKIRLHTRLDNFLTLQGAEAPTRGFLDWRFVLSYNGTLTSLFKLFPCSSQ